MNEIVILDGYTENPGDLSWEGFEKLGRLTVYDRTPAAEIIPRIGGANIVYTNKTPLNAAVLAACPSIRFIGLLATGYNVVDVAEATKRGIPVANIPAYSTAAVAQATMALLLEICNRVGHYSRAVRGGTWQRSADFCYWDTPLIELSGKTMGIIGYGRIGRAVGALAAALGMRVVANTRHPDKMPPSETVRAATLEELYARSDVISLHCPLFPETEGLIDRSSIAKMKDGVILLNTSRGPLVNERDLAHALNSGKVFAAGVDVVSVEPILPDNPLLTAKNCYVTPHIAWAPKATRQRLMDIAVENLAAFLRGEPQNIVNS